MLPLREGCNPECKACPHRQWTSLESLTQKNRFLNQTLAPWSSVLEEARSVPDDRRWGYRRRTQLHVRWDASSNSWSFGLLKRIPTERDPILVSIPDCPVQTIEINRQVAWLRENLRKDPGLPVFAVLTDGKLLSVVLKSAFKFSLDQLFEKNISEISQELRELGCIGLLSNLNPSAGNRIISSKGWNVLWGESRYKVQMGQGELWYGPGIFEQLLPGLYGNALSEAFRFLNPKSGDTGLDLYCGNGASFSYWNSARIVGVELNGEAIRCAKALNLENVTLYQGKVSDRLKNVLVDQTGVPASSQLLAFVNPPRLGLESGCIEQLAEFGIERIAYLSCSAGTLKRDLSCFESLGYSVSRIIPYDFFPQTLHVECLALIQRDSSLG